MKLKFLLFLMALITIGAVAQPQEIYLNDDLNYISKSEYQKVSNENVYNLRFETDTLIVNVNVERIKKGILSKSDYDLVKTALNKASGREVPENHMIVINYHHGADKCNSSASQSLMSKSNKVYLKKIGKMNAVSQFFMYEFPEGIEKYGKQIEWIKDDAAIVAATFLPLHYPCGSYVIIDNDGRFYVYKGEYKISTIIDLIKNKAHTFSDK